jgi:hypothetical protein
LSLWPSTETSLIIGQLIGTPRLLELVSGPAELTMVCSFDLPTAKLTTMSFSSEEKSLIDGSEW